MLSFLTVGMNIGLEILVVTSTVLDMFTGTFVKSVGFIVLGLGFVTPTVEPTVVDNGFSVVVVMLVYSGLVVFVVVLVILVGFNFVVVDNNGLAVVALAVVDLTVDDCVVVFKVVFGVVVFVIDTFSSGLFVVMVVF